MTALGLIIFIIIVGSSNLYFSYHRKEAIKDLSKTERELNEAIKELHNRA